jgi:hypothetical protein
MEQLLLIPRQMHHARGAQSVLRGASAAREGAAAMKRGRKPLPPAVREARKRERAKNRHVLSITFPSLALAQRFVDLIGDEDRTTVILAALCYWRGCKLRTRRTHHAGSAQLRTRYSSRAQTRRSMGATSASPRAKTADTYATSTPYK